MMRYAGIAAFALVVAASGAVRADPASQPQIYVYQVEHPTYGNIGTYTNTVLQNGDAVDVETQLHVAVKMLGISLFHQDANRLEHWEKGRLISFRGNTDDNGKEIDIDGKAQGNSFVILSPLVGTVTAPEQVHPSNPWSKENLDTDYMMGTKTGKVLHVVVTDTGQTSVTFDGQKMTLHQFFIDDDKHQVVWLDDKGVVAAFQTEEAGTRITFVLKPDKTSAAAQPIPAPVPLMRADNP